MKSKLVLLGAQDSDPTRLGAAELEQLGKVAVARFGVMKEGLAAVRSLCDLLRADQRRRETIAEWDRRIVVAERELESARIKAETARDQAAAQHAALSLKEKQLDAMLALFYDVLAEARTADIDRARRDVLRQLLLELIQQLRVG